MIDYRELVDYESRKLLDLFFLLVSADGKEKLELFSKKLLIDAKTILRYIKKLNYFIRQFQLEQHLSISTKSRNLFYLKRSSDYYIDVFVTYFLKTRPEISFLKAVIEEEAIHTKEFSDHLSISESSLRRRIKRINIWLQKKKLRLRRGSYELLGDESQIRAFILHFYWFVYQGTEAHFLPIDTHFYSKIEETFLLFFQIQLNELQRKTFIRMIHIAIWRERKGHRIQLKKEWEPYLNDSAIFSKFVKRILKDETSQKIDRAELSYLYLIIQANFLPYFDSSVQAYIIEEHFLNKTNCYLTTLKATNQFRHIFWEKKIEHSKSSVLAFLAFHLLYELVSDFSFERTRVVLTLEERYPKFMRKLNEGLYELKKKESFFRRIPEEILIHRYFTLFATLIPPVYFEQRLFICLLTDLSLELEHELGKRITDYFHNKYNIMVIYARKSSSISYSSVILTTVFHNELFQKHKHKVMLIDQHFSEKQFDQLEVYLKNARKRK
jgi:hypothetical protein